ncbi:MAG: type IV toxin-antitoxin system AbiEi family antitoxin domain-containing protein [Solirubrobacteraceae bacterium]
MDERPRARIASVAEEQWGLVTRRQARELGIPETTWERLSGSGRELRRVGYGVYQLVGAPEPDHLELRAAWLQLAPGIPAWEREPGDGVVSHRSAAEMFGLGHLAADVHDFTVGGRRQSRHQDIRLHTRRLADDEWIRLRGLLVTRPSRIASDLLYEHEDPESVAHIIADSLRSVYDHPGTFADALASHAHRFGFRRHDGLGLLRWLLDLVGDADTNLWMNEARAHYERTADSERPPTPRSRDGAGA